MVSQHKPRSRLRPGWFDRDHVRALIVFFVLLLLFGLIGYFGTGPSEATRSGVPHPGFDDDELRTGSILFVPVFGTRCRQRLIDNATWRIRDGDEVDCRTALARHNLPKPIWSSARVDVVRDGFRRK